MANHDELNRMYRRRKAALTRALSTGDPHRVIVACDDALAEFARVGSPDTWSRWQREREDAVLAVARARDPWLVGA